MVRCGHAPVVLRCHVDINVARVVVVGVQVMQISRPCRLDTRLMPVPLDTKPARDHSGPLVFACAGSTWQGATVGEQLCLWGKVGLTFSQTRFGRLPGLVSGLVGAVRVTGCCAEATGTLYVDCVGTPSATTHHIVYS